MRLDSEIRYDIEQELRSDPNIDATYVAVNVNDGVASLTGYVLTDPERRAAEAAARRVSGVLGVADEIEVRPPSVDDRLDPDVARDAAAAIERTNAALADRIVVLVANGWVRLEGDVDSRQQSDQLKAAVEQIAGVRGVVAELRFQPVLEPTVVKQAIVDAFLRNAETVADHIVVETHSGTVVLKGTVRSWAEREEAARTAWHSPGITKVENQITVSEV